jgi:hypothetical protein
VIWPGVAEPRAVSLWVARSNRPSSAKKICILQTVTLPPASDTDQASPLVSRRRNLRCGKLPSLFVGEWLAPRSEVARASVHFNVWDFRALRPPDRTSDQVYACAQAPIDDEWTGVEYQQQHIDPVNESDAGEVKTGKSTPNARTNP